MLRDVPVDDQEWRVSAEPIRDAALRAALLETVERIAAVLGPDHDDPAVADDIVSAHRHLEDSTALLTGSLRSGRAGDRPRGTTRDAVVDLLLDIRELSGRVDDAREAARQLAFTRVREAMGLLRGVTTVEQMLDRAPIAAARVGFDRAFISSIQDSCFVPRTCFMNGDKEWEEAIVRAGRETPRRLDRSLLETEMVRRRQPIRVLDAQNDPRVHPEIAKVSMSRSYVAVPIVVQDRVVGFIHADHFDRRRLVGPMDADALWMFSEAFGFAFERIAYGERIAGLRDSFLRSMEATAQEFASACDGEVGLEQAASHVAAAGATGAFDAPRAPVPVPASAARPGLDHVLTKRELEVLRLMAGGATNDGIASRLVISHGTAKTHVKHILRKLRAANRAEAVSRYFQLEHQSEIRT
jgi:DNA-binding CsgD family transcriptional regulator